MKSAIRKPLQPKNTFLPYETTPPPTTRVIKPKVPPLFPSDSNKENHHPIPSVDASLAEELSAFRKKLERLRLDGERTEKTLKERHQFLDLQMEDLLRRGEIQKMLEIEVDRLFRLKELHSFSTKISPIRSLREKEQEKKNDAGVALSPIIPLGDEMEESEGENRVQSPSSIQSQQITPVRNN